MLLAAMAGAVGFVLIGAPLPLEGLAFSVVLTGIGLSLVMPATLAVTFAIAPTGSVGMATSLRTTFARLTQFAGPLAAGLAASATGSAGVFAITGGLIAVSALGTFRALKNL